MATRVDLYQGNFTPTSSPIMTSSSRLEKMMNVCQNCKFSFRFRSDSDKFCSKDCITSYSFTNGLCNLVSPFEVQAGGPRGFAEGDSGDAENRMQQVFQFERELAQQDQERATRPGMILTTEEKYGAMSKYFEPKKPKVAPLRVSQMGVRVSRNKLWGV